jgi:hypothetical protein
MPAIGATNNLLRKTCAPIRMSRGVFEKTGRAILSALRAKKNLEADRLLFFHGSADGP